MDKQELQQLIKALEPFLESKMKENSYMIANTTNKEHSRFIGELRENNKTLVKEFNDFKQEVRSYIKDDNLWKETFFKEDKKWKEEAMPVLDAGTKALNFGSVGMGILKFFGVLGGAVAVIYAFFKWIK